MKIQMLNNGRWENNETEIKTLREAREALRQRFCGSWDDDKMQELDDIAHDKATGANVGDILVGASGTKWRIA